MKSQTAREILGAAVARGADRGRGVATPRLVRLSANRAAELGIGDVSKLPIRPGAPDLQDPDSGALYFLVGYSAVGGPDVVK